MPRKRIVLFLWILGAFLLLGLWGHSIFRYGFFRYSHPSGGKRATIGVVGGSFEVTWGTAPGNGPARWAARSLPFRKHDHLRKNRARLAGRFLYKSVSAGFPPGKAYSRALECPLWFLLLLWTALCSLLYYYFARKQKAPPPEVPLDPDSTPSPNTDL